MSANRGVPLLLVVGLLLAAGGAFLYALHTLQNEYRGQGAVAQADDRPADSSTLFDLAAQGDAPAIERLVAKGVHHGETRDALGTSGVTALMVAAHRGNTDAVKALIKAEPKSISARTREGNSALLYAAGWGGPAVTDALLAGGASPDARNDAGWTPAMMAASRGDPGALQRLVDAGADVRARNKWGQSVLMHAVQSGSAEKIQQLIAKGADVNETDDEGRTALARAAASPSGDPEASKIITALIKSGAHLNHADAMGLTALMAAADQGDMTRVVQLLNAGANAKLADKQGRKAADWARARDTEESRQVAKALAEAETH